MIKNHNVRRWSIIQSLKRKNLTLAEQIKDFMIELEPVKKTYMKKLVKKLTACAGLSLYAEQPGSTVGITGHLCEDKLCFVCNSQRSRVTRRKYRTWFEANQVLFEVTPKNGLPKVVTSFQYQKHFEGASYTPVAYDVMHFTLTVPHTEERGFRGVKLYYDEFTNIMTAMRRLKFWKENILGGEYGFETERKTKGLHIHVHGLMFVRRFIGNRNYVHRELLMNWNRLSVDEDAPLRELTDEVKTAILAGNKTLTESDILQMDLRGATFMNLESIHYFKNKRKIYITDFSDPNMMRGIMEAIKYHFEPAFFNKQDNQFDLQMVADIKPLIHGKALYKKFGCLVGETSLNINENMQVEYADAVEDFDPGTGEILNRDFYTVNPALMYADANNIVWSHAAVHRRRQIRARTTSEAVAMLATLIREAGKSGQLG